MAEHEPCIGATDDWYTPPDIFDALGLIFDLDPCSPGPAHWVPARKIYTKEDDGLVQPWSGTVFMNPPFGRRNGHVPWLRKFLAHGDGVAIVRAYTSSAWFHQWAVKAQTMCFPRGKTKFIRPDGSIGRAPGHGVVLLGMGAVANKALAQCGLGFFVTVGNCEATVSCRPCPQLLEALRLSRDDSSRSPETITRAHFVPKFALPAFGTSPNASSTALGARPRPRPPIQMQRDPHL